MVIHGGGDPEVEKLYNCVELLTQENDKSQLVHEYKEILSAVYGSNKAKQLAAQLIPRFYGCFPDLTGCAVDAYFDLLESEDLGTRVQAIRALPLLCKETPDVILKIVYVLGQLLIAEENVEYDAVHKSLMSLLLQDPKASLTGLFGHLLGNDENIRGKVINFLKDKVFPIKSELLKPQQEMERHVIELVKKSLQDVTGAEFKLFMDFLSSLSMFGEKRPPDCVQELIEIIEGQADLDAPFDVSDVDHFDRLISCMSMAITYYMRHPSNSKFLQYVSKHITPVFGELHEDQKLALLKTLAEFSPFAVVKESRELLPCIVQLLKKYMPTRITGGQVNYTYMECLLYTFHNLSYKTPNITNGLCGYKIVTGQPSHRLGEDFSNNNKDFTERLKYGEELVIATIEKLNQGFLEHTKKISAAKTEDDKAIINEEIRKITIGIRMCSNILSMIQPLDSKSPLFLGNDKIKLSWKDVKKLPISTKTIGGTKRTASADSIGTYIDPLQKSRGRGHIKISRGSLHGPKRSKKSRGWRDRGRGRGLQVVSHL